LARVLDHARDVEALDLADVPPTSHPYPLRNVMRPDEVRPSLDRDEVVAAAPAAEDGQFRVPPGLGAAPWAPPTSPPAAPRPAPPRPFAPAAARRSMSWRSASRPAPPAAASPTPTTASPPGGPVGPRARSTRASPPARTRARWPACRSRSRTACAPGACPPP